MKRLSYACSLMPDDRDHELQNASETHQASADAPSRPSRVAPRHRRRPADEGEEDVRFPAKSIGDPVVIRQLALDIARNVADDRCEHVIILDVREVSQVAEFIVIGSGTSQRQMSAALAHVRDMGKERGTPAWRVSEDERTTWLLADFVDVVVHLFEPNTRAHYDLEMLWGDVPRIDWRQELGLPPRYPRHEESEEDEGDASGS